MVPSAPLRFEHCQPQALPAALTLQVRTEDPSSAAPTADASVLWGGESLGTMLPGQALTLAWARTRSLALPPLLEGEMPWGEGLEGALQIHA